jgi:chromosome segregation ATPase
LNKWLSIGIIAVLVIGLATTGYLYSGKSTDLNNANAQIASQKTTIAGLNKDVDDSKAETANVQKQLSDSQANVVLLNGNITDLTGKNTKLSADLNTANTSLASTQSSLTSTQGQLTSAQSSITTLNATVKKVSDQKHFTSVADLTAWLQKDDTNTKYKSLATTNIHDYLLMSYILEVRAARDGYILPTYYLPDSSGNSWVSNYAIIGDTMYLVEAGDDSVTAYWKLGSVQPADPEPLP